MLTIGARLDRSQDAADRPQSQPKSTSLSTRFGRLLQSRGSANSLQILLPVGVDVANPLESGHAVFKAERLKRMESLAVNRLL